MSAKFRKFGHTFCTNRLFTCRKQFKHDASNSVVDKSKWPLAGVRVLDLSRVLAGPYCSMILGDLGAEIIKVERPGIGDETRTWIPPRVKSESAYFLSVNRNKKSITVDTKIKEGSQLVQQLAGKSDVLLENFLPGKLAKMGLGYEQLKQINPRLIYCSITGYGQTGPYSERGGYDTIASGMGGLMHITGPVEGDPCRVGIAMTDMSTGLYAAVSILASLMHRERTSQGQYIDCNLLSTQVATMTHLASNYLNAGEIGTRHGTGHGSIVPYQAFPTADGYINIGCGNNILFKAMCEAIDLPEVGSDSDYAENELRVKHRTKLIKVLSDRFNEKTTAEWMERFEGASFPYGPINDMSQVFSDPQVLHNKMIQEMDHPTVGTVRVPGPAVRYSNIDTMLQCPPPTLGQHTDKVLTDVLGYKQDYIDKLRSMKAIG